MLRELNDELICPPSEEHNPFYHSFYVDASEPALPFQANFRFDLRGNHVVKTAIDIDWVYQDIDSTSVFSKIALTHTEGLSWEEHIGRMVLMEKARIVHHKSVIVRILQVAGFSPSTRIRDNHSLRKRLQHLGHVRKETAISFGITGPTLRASGISDDLRRDDQTGVYTKFGFQIATQTSGDAWARLLVRLDEIEASNKLIEQAAQFPEYFLHDVKSIPPNGYTSHIESPEGELGVYVFNGQTHIRSPSFALVSALPTILAGAHIDDVLLITTSLGIKKTAP